jgi:hypothetical protein
MQRFSCNARFVAVWSLLEVLVALLQVLTSLAFRSSSGNFAFHPIQLFA